MTSAKDKLGNGRRLVCARMPYLATAVYAMAPVEVPGLLQKAGGGMATTETMALLYDPKVIEEDWDDEDVAMGIYHEVGHHMRNHIGRGMAYGIDPRSDDARIWNIAGDAPINDDGEAAGFKLLDSDITSAKLGVEKNITVEEIYEELKNRPKPPQQDKCCGSGAGHSFEDEPDTLPQGHPAHRSPADIDRTRRATAEAVRDAVSKGQDSVPAGWAQWADLILEPPKVPWQSKLARIGRNRIATKLGEVDYVFNGISHLQGGIGFGPGVPILPVLMAPEIDVMIAVDTSGSMGKSEIQQAANEAAGIMRQAGSRVTLLACDCEVHDIKECRTVDDILKCMKRGGGTSFVPVFKKIAELGKKPDILVFITDGGGDAPLEAPPFDTIWCLVGAHKCQPSFGGWNGQGTPWGDYIEVD